MKEVVIHTFWQAGLVDLIRLAIRRICPLTNMLTERIGYREHIFIAAAAHIHNNQPVFSEFLGEVDGARDGVAGL